MSGPGTGVWLFPDADSRRIVALAERAEVLGLDELWLGDEGPARDPFGLLAAAAVQTERLRLGIAVTNPYVRHPAITAAAAMTLHELSGGRAVLGLGPGGQIALGPLGIPRVRPLARTHDALRVVRAVANAVVTDGYRPPANAFVRPDLPVWIGARGEGFNRFASEAADGAFVAGIPLPLQEVVIGWARSVRPIDIGLYVSAVFDDADLELVRPRLIFSLVDAPAMNCERLGIDATAAREAATTLAGGDPTLARRVITDAVLDQILLHGTPAEVGSRLADIVARLAPTSVGLSLLTPNLERGLEDAAAALAHVRPAYVEARA